MDASQFRRVWSTLKKKGWKHRPATGLESAIRYVRPGCTVQGQRNVDYFVGDFALIAYLFANPREVDREFALWVATRDRQRAANLASDATAAATLPAPTTPTPPSPSTIGSARKTATSKAPPVAASAPPDAPPAASPALSAAQSSVAAAAEPAVPQPRATDPVAAALPSASVVNKAPASAETTDKRANRKRKAASEVTTNPQTSGTLPQTKRKTKKTMGTDNAERSSSSPAAKTVTALADRPAKQSNPNDTHALPAQKPNPKHSTTSGPAQPNTIAASIVFPAVTETREQNPGTEVSASIANEGNSRSPLEMPPTSELSAGITHVFGDRRNATDRRLIVTDRFYTSVALALQLLTIGFYSVGTIITNCLGYAKDIIDKRKKRPAGVERGTCTITTSLHVPKMSALCWWDNKPVHFLATGGSLDLDRVARREKSGERVDVPAPKVIKDYQRYMGGVDVHDQLRLQRYSIQGAVRFQKYYKSLFLGLVDIAIVNAFIVYRYAQKRQNKIASHVKFMKEMHAQLCQVQAEDMENLSDAETAEDPVIVRSRTEHLPEKTDEWRAGNGPNDRKRRQRACKVCSLLKEDGARRGNDTRMVCSTCRIKDQRVYLCDVPRREYNGVRMTCFDIWHKKWLCGKAIRGTEKKIRARPAPSSMNTDVGG